jgi:predicted Fe-Mo cluster-binding NifX family protein
MAEEGGKMKTAIASTDGKVVNQHFGRADKFYIVDVNEDTYEFRLTEERKTVPVCQSGDHNDTDMAEAVERLSDCDSVLVSRIGIRAKNEFEKRGI